jgi:hypothetical protein
VVGADGLARYVSGDYWAANQPYFEVVWRNVMPISVQQLLGFAQHGFLGGEL